MHFDTVNNQVGVFSDDVDVKGRPVLQWEMNLDSGHITETKRMNDEVVITHKDIDPATLEKESNDFVLDEETEGIDQFLKVMKDE